MLRDTLAMMAATQAIIATRHIAALSARKNARPFDFAGARAADAQRLLTIGRAMPGRHGMEQKFLDAAPDEKCVLMER